MNRPAIAITGLTACSGCQLTLLNCEEELPVICGQFRIDYFPTGLTERRLTGPKDVALVEGAVSSPDDLEILIKLRRQSRLLIALGTCACWGGIAAMNNSGSRNEMVEMVYPETADDLKTFNPQPLHQFVKVDFSITGCPPEKGEVLALLAALSKGTFPEFPGNPVCADCRSRENICLLMERNEICLGPITRGGCQARCPAVGVGCEGCRGPYDEANIAEELKILMEKGFLLEEIRSRMRRFSPEWNYAQRS